MTRRTSKAFGMAGHLRITAGTAPETDALLSALRAVTHPLRLSARDGGESAT